MELLPFASIKLLSLNSVLVSICNINIHKYFLLKTVVSNSHTSEFKKQNKTKHAGGQLVKPSFMDLVFVDVVTVKVILDYL